MDSEENAYAAVDTAVNGDGVRVGNSVSGVMFLHGDDIDSMLDLLDEHDGKEGGCLVTELRAQLQKQR